MRRGRRALEAHIEALCPPRLAPLSAFPEALAGSFHTYLTHRYGDARACAFLGGQPMGEPLMAWSEKYRLGFREIDEQHQWLFHLINALSAELKMDTPDRSAQGMILEGLSDYTMKHFIVEEELFQRHKYPEEKAHLDEHNGFTKHIMDTLQAHERGESVVDQKLLEFLRRWLVHHIMVIDKAYVPHLSQFEKR